MIDLLLASICLFTNNMWYQGAAIMIIFLVSYHIDIQYGSCEHRGIVVVGRA